MGILLAMFATLVVSGTGFSVQAPVGEGFTVVPADLAFILKQIKIAEHHAATLTPADPCGTLVGPGPDQIPEMRASLIRYLGRRVAAQTISPWNDIAAAHEEVYRLVCHEASAG